MFKTLFDFLLNRKGHPTQHDTATMPDAPVAPAKTETAPVVIEPTKCGCGRSSTGYCVGLHKLTPEQWNGHPANPAPVAVAAEPEKKVEAPAKAPKVGKTAAKAAKAADEKKKPAAMKAPAKPRAKKAKE